MTWFTKLDAWIISKFEQFTHWFQLLTGKTSRFLMLAGLAVFAACLVVELVLSVTFDWVAFVMIAIVLSRMMFNWNHLEVPGFCNRLKINPVHCATRYMMLFFSIALVAIACTPLKSVPHGRLLMDLMVIRTLSYTCSCYFECCDSLPPCVGKIKEWIRGLGKSLRLVQAS